MEIEIYYSTVNEFKLIQNVYISTIMGLGHCWQSLKYKFEFTGPDKILEFIFI